MYANEYIYEWESTLKIISIHIANIYVSMRIKSDMHI